jgi:hypothetical protein
MKRKGRYTSTTREEFPVYGVLDMFSMRGPCRRFTGDNEGRLQSVVE